MGRINRISRVPLSRARGEDVLRKTIGDDSGDYRKRVER